MRPQDANLAGNVHGGIVMALCDEAGALAAIRHCRSRVVTAAMDRMIFLNPVYVGHLVTLRSSVNAAWRTSMEVGVRVEAEDITTGVITHTSSAYLTMVALDEDGRPTEVPSLECETDTQRRREREAQLRRANRLAEREHIVEARAAE
jgi:acyl-CoA hydrolase